MLGFQNKTVHFSLKIYSLQCSPVLRWYSDLKEEGKTCGKSSILRVVVPWDSHECVYTQWERLQIEWAHSFTSYILKKDPDEITRSYTKESQPKRTSLTMGPAFMNQKLLKFWKTEISRVILRPNLSKGSEDSHWEQETLSSHAEPWGGLSSDLSLEIEESTMVSD